jgi:hypothetical protein
MYYEIRNIKYGKRLLSSDIICILRVGERANRVAAVDGLRKQQDTNI